MGEAKRRQNNVSWTDNHDPRVLAIFEDVGEPISIALIGAGLILPTVTATPFDELTDATRRHFSSLASREPQPGTLGPGRGDAQAQALKPAKDLR